MKRKWSPFQQGHNKQQKNNREIADRRANLFRVLMQKQNAHGCRCSFTAIFSLRPYACEQRERASIRLLPLSAGQCEDR